MGAAYKSFVRQIVGKAKAGTAKADRYFKSQDPKGETDE